MFLSTLWFLDCKRNFSITFWFDYRTQYTLTFTVSGTNLSRTFTNVSKVLSAINANILNINTYLIEKRIYINMVTLDCAHSFENNSVTASCNIRCQIINELDIFIDAIPIETLRLDYMFSSFWIISIKQSFGNFPILITILKADWIHKGIIYL